MIVVGCVGCLILSLLVAFIVFIISLLEPLSVVSCVVSLVGFSVVVVFSLVASLLVVGFCFLPLITKMRKTESFNVIINICIIHMEPYHNHQCYISLPPSMPRWHHYCYHQYPSNESPTQPLNLYQCSYPKHIDPWVEVKGPMHRSPLQP